MNLKTFSKMVSDYSHFHTKLNKSQAMTAELPREGHFRGRCETVSGNSLSIPLCPGECKSTAPISGKRVASRQH